MISFILFPVPGLSCFPGPLQMPLLALPSRPSCGITWKLLVNPTQRGAQLGAIPLLWEI